MFWKVQISEKRKRLVEKLPLRIKKLFRLLVDEIKTSGPHRNMWKNFGKIENDLYHCHLKKGHPTYVAVWKIVDKKKRIVEVIYVGTHEKAPY